MEEAIETAGSTETVSNARKRKWDNGGPTSSPKHPLLESIAHRFQQNQADRQSKMMELETKREAELAHSKFIKKNIADPQELVKANTAVKHWVKANGVKGAPILGTKPSALAGSSTPSRLNNQSQTRSNRNSGESTNGKQKTNQAKSAGGKQKKKMQKTIKDQENSRNTSNTSSTEVIDLSGSFTGDIDSVNNVSSTANVIDLDALTDFECDNTTEIIEILDQSNNSNNQDTANRSSKRYVTRQTLMHTCAVFNCEAVFSSEGALSHHENLFKHSPCNPCLKIVDCKVSPDTQCFMCPKCDKEFQTADACRRHMKSAGHMTFLPPLSISSYMCAHCLHVFESYQSCWEHIEKSQHKEITYSFADDHGLNGGIGPVPVAEELLQDLTKKCEKVAYRVQCLECSMDIENPAILSQHMLETNKQHIVSALADCDLVDVFAGYLAGYSCDTCCRLFSGGIKELANHQCADGIIGTIKGIETKSFSEFIKQCALTVIKSEVTSKTTVTDWRPGPSCVKLKTPPKKKNKLKSVIEISDSPVCINDSEDELDLTEGLSAADESNIHSENKKTEVEPTEQVVSIPDDSHKVDDPLQCSDEDSHQCNLPLISESKRKKLRGEQGVKHNPCAKQNQPNDTKILGIPMNFALPPPQPYTASNSINKQGRTLLPVPMQSVQPHILTKQGQNQPPPVPLPTCQKNFYCHPPPQNLSAMPHPRYPLRHQNKNDAANSSSRGCPGNFIRIGQKNPSQSIVQDDQVAGPSHPPAVASEVVPMDTSDNSQSLKRDRSRSPVIGVDSPVSIENLMIKKNIIFLDLDNWPAFFTRLPRILPEGTFVWGFFGGKNIWKEPHKCFVFREMKLKKQFYLNEQCGVTKDAADFAIVLTVGKMDVLLPHHVAFTILSGDKGFCEVERQMKMSKRRAVVINPHQAEKLAKEMIYTMVTSVTDT